MVLITAANSMQLVFTLLILFTFLIIPSFGIPPEYRNYTYSAGNFTKDSPFEASLSNALQSLTNISSSKHFSNVTVGLSESNRVYALFSCQHDLPLEICHSCVENATDESLDVFIYSAKEAIFIYKECMLRYANRMIFSTMELEPYNNYCSIIMYYTHAIEIGRTIEREFQVLIYEATNSEDYFAVGRVNNVIDIHDVYFMVQCTPDLTKEECNQCLLHALNLTIGSCAIEGRLSGRIIGPSCFMRYDTEPFFYTEVIPVGVPSNQPPPWKNTKEDGPLASFARTAWGVFLIFLLFFILFLGCYRAWCRK